PTSPTETSTLSLHDALPIFNGSFDEDRARRVVHDVVDTGRSGRLGVLSRFEHLVKLDRLEHTAKVESAAPLPSEVRGSIEADLADRKSTRLNSSHEWISYAV